jgi:hypothetical protein
MLSRRKSSVETQLRLSLFLLLIFNMSELLKRQVNKGVEAAKEDVSAIGNLGAEAAKSGACEPFLPLPPSIRHAANHQRLLQTSTPCAHILASHSETKLTFSIP